MKRSVLALMSLLFGSLAFSQVSIGIVIGPPPPPRVVRVLPPTPGPEYIWVEGYWYPVEHHYRWHSGYWTRPPYAGARWVMPRHDGERFYDGYWEGEHGRREHDHHWDRDRDRDFREHGRGRGHDRDGDHDRD